MRKLVVTEFLSLDGVMESPAWSYPYWNDEIGKYKYKELCACDALLLGRVTYEGFAALWPLQTDDEGFADRMNGIAKYVVSRTLQKAEWNNSRLIKRNIVKEVSKLKRQAGQDILIAGSCELIQTLMQYDLVDQYNLLVYPVVLGVGKRLFQDESDTRLKLVESNPFSSGVLGLVYRPARRR
jgi:dihydrofolate reductase